MVGRKTDRCVLDCDGTAESRDQDDRRPSGGRTPARPRWAGILALALVIAVAGCGGDDEGSQGSDDASETPSKSPATAYDGAWSGTLSTGGLIEFTVSDGTITAVKITSGDNVFGPGCGQVSGSNEFPDAQIAIEDGKFSWGGPDEGYPVEGQFDSETTASGTAEFSAPEVMGEPAQGCHAASATWEATTSQPTETGIPTETTTGGVSAAAAACVADLGYEITEAGATDLPIADADGEGLPVVDGSAGIGIRGKTGAGVFYVYATNQQASAAYTGSTGNPDIELVAPRVDAIAIDNVFVMSNAEFVSDDRFYLADCFD